ncbi:choline/ethanolaminephosphotransferase [Populus alba x Populus x berolinensis]|nr:choline/ethanolaminephosphotransferase [Populus alba x Populus x berolinensis]
MGYIGSHGIAALHRYKYSGVDHSYVAKYVLQPFWSRCVNFFPLWMPPNMITLMGFMFLVTSALLGYIYSPRLDTPPPRWVHFAHGLLLFLYQTFDAVDGKQARRTNSSSPLGELFDHGCDALACAFESLAFGSTAMCGRDSFWFWLISAVPFYGATWEHFFTNTLILPAVNGPTEGLMLIYVAHLFTALVGAEWWVQHFGMSFPFLSWVPFVSEIQTYRVVLILMTAFAVIPTVAFNVSNVYKVVQARKSSMLLALAMLYPFLVLVGGVLVWDYLSPSDLMANYPHLVVLGTGLAFGFLVSLLYLPFAIANALAARLNDGVALVDEFWVLLGYCCYSICTSPHLSSMKLQQLWEYAASAGNSGAVGQTIWNVIFGSTLMNTVVTGSSGTGSGSTSVTNYFIYVTIELGDLGNARFFLSTVVY